MIDTAAVRMLEKLDRIIALLTKQNRLIALSLPSSPRLTKAVQVTTAPTLLATNESVPYLYIVITNDDPAGLLWVGGKDVLSTMGRVVLPQVTIPYVIPRGESVWGVCAAASISVRVSEGFDLTVVGGAEQP